MKCKRFLAMALSAGIVLTSSFANTSLVFAQEHQTVTKEDESVQTQGGTEATERTQVQETEADTLTTVKDGLGVTLKEVEKDSVSADLYAGKTEEDGQLEVVPEDDEMVHVIIVMDGDSVIEKNTKASMNFWTRLQAGLIERKQDKVVSNIESKVLDGEELTIKYHYSWLLNGIAAEVPYGMIEDIRAVNGVEDVILQPIYEVESSTGMDSRTIADGGMIGREDTWSSGYTGKGIKIAIIDTGLDDDHQNFQAMSEDKLTEESATMQTVEKVLGDLNASELYPNLTVNQVYYNNKVAFGFNYIDQNTIINHSKDSQGDHGTHVAGIAAANDLGNGEAVGVAPDAQLYVMKIFGANGGAYTEDILASLEDALKLGADVINMSLGSPAGFTSEGEKMDEIYARVSETNTILAVAAGNSTTSGLNNIWGTDTNLTSNPDNSIISSPAVFQNVTSVASIENEKIQSNYFEINGKKFAFIEGSGGINESIAILSGKNLEYAMVGNYGQTLADFTEAGVAGKVAVVQRGITNFTAKHQLAQDAGAIACLIYNNTTGSLSMGLTDGTATIPCASITLSAGECLAAAKEADENAALYIGAGKALIANEDGGRMSDFSSWGISPDLSLEPDITAPGGNIYSTLDGGTYGIMSGTSMATPNVAGISALVMQYAKETNPDMSDSQLHTFVNALLISTSTPVVYDEQTGLTYSPRQQGSGLANAYSATKTKAYLSVDENDMPEAELFDDVDKNGNYDFTYHVHNFGDSTIYYSLSTNVQTEGVDSYGEYKFMSTTPYALSGETKESSSSLVLAYDYDGDGKADSHDARELYLNAIGKKTPQTGEEFRYELDETEGISAEDAKAYLDALVGKHTKTDLDSQLLKVEAGKTADVDVSISLSQADRDYMDQNFENGIYVEGFTKLTARSTGDVDLSMPYLAFYGDWTKAPLIDDGYYWEETISNASQYVNILWTSIQGSDWMPGLNPYLEDEAFDVNNITMSPNEDGITDSIEDIYISLLRNANTLQLTYENAETGEIYYDETYDKIQKTYYVSGAGSMMPFIHAYYSDNQYGFTDSEGNVLPNNTVVLMKAKAALDYEKHDSKNAFDTWEVAIAVDTEAPTVKKAEVVKENGKQYLELTFQDNQKVAAVCFLNKAGAVVKARYAVDSKPGEEVTERYDITGYGNEFMLVLGDYAVNETYYEVETDENIPEVDTSLLYGYRVATDTIYDDSLYGWVAVDLENVNEAGAIVVQAQDSEYYVDYSLQAAEYIDGVILAVNAGGQLVRLTPGAWDDRTVIAEYGFEIKEITYDPVDKVLYGYTGGNDSTYEIVKIDILTGELTGLGELYTWWYARPFAMACDSAGNLYGIDSNGLLKTIDKTTGMWNDEVLLDTGLEPYNVQSMVYNQDENSIYWAAHLMDETSYIYKIDLTNNYEFTLIGALDDNPELNGLVFLDEKNFEIPEENAADIVLDSDTVSILAGTSIDLGVSAKPWYGDMGTLVWESSNEAIVSVDVKGTITGKKEGTAIVTVSSRDIPGLTASCEVSVIKPKSDLYGFVIGSGSGVANQWIHVNTGYLKGVETVSDLSWVTYSAAEYYDGYIYAYNDTTEFYRIDPKNYLETKLTNPNKEWSMKDMAFDYSTGYMFGIATWNQDGMTYLVHIDITTGLIEKANVRPLVDDKYGMPITLAISTDGIIYMITDTGYLCEYEGEKQNNNSGAGDDAGIDGDFGIGDDFIDDGYVGDDGIGDDFIDDDLWDDDFWGDDFVDTSPLTLKTIGVTGVSHIAGLTSMVYDHNTGDMYYNYADGVNVEQLALVDLKNGTARTIGAIAGGSQIIGLYAVPENEHLPAEKEVPVTGVTATTDTLNLVIGMQIAVPVNVQPFNASDKTIHWTISDETVISISNNMITALAKGSAVVTAEVSGFTAEFTVNVYEAAGDMKGFIVYDFMYEEAEIWSKFNDSDLSTGLGLANADEYSVDAAEYYNGKVYVYDNLNGQYLVLNAASSKYEVEKRLIVEHPDMIDMAFDYSEGVMYAISCIRNVDTNTSLYAVNLEDGSCYKVGDQSGTMRAIACTTDGILYGVDSYGDFYQIDKRTGAETYLFSTGYSGNVYQSMAYDHNTGNLYWAQCYWDLDFGSSANLILIDVEKQVSIVLGQIGASGCQVTGLYIDPKGEMITQKPQAEAVTLSAKDEMLAVGDMMKVSAYAVPLSVSYADAVFTFTSSDESVVVVDAEGNVTAVGVGTAVISASYQGMTGECKFTVVDAATELYVFNPNGWETSPLMSPMTINEKILLSEYNTEFRIAEATLNTDGYFYAVGEDGYLWKFTKDLGFVEKIGEKPVLEQLDNLEELNEASWSGSIQSLRLKALTANVFSGKVYALVEVDYSSSYLYEIDLATGAASVVMKFSWNLYMASALTFESEDSMIVYDGNMDYIYRVSMVTGEESALVWAQGTVVSAEDIGMYYSKSLNRVFLTTTNESPYIESQTIDLYVLNLGTNSFKKLGQAVYNQEVKGLVMLEGIELAVGITEQEVLSEELVSDTELSDSERTDTEISDSEMTDTETGTGTEISDTEVADSEASDLETPDSEIADTETETEISDGEAADGEIPDTETNKNEK